MASHFHTLLSGEKAQVLAVFLGEILIGPPEGEVLVRVFALAPLVFLVLERERFAIIVTQDAQDAVVLAKYLHYFIGKGTVSHRIPDVPDFFDPQAFDVGQHRLQCGQVSVDVPDQCHFHV